MASQRVLILAIGGILAECVWKNICRWSNARTVTCTNQWSPDDWPVNTRNEIESFVDRIASSGFTPPVLYRTEYVDCWSMADTYEAALVKASADYRRLLTTSHEIIATWARYSEKIISDRDEPAETQWLYARINEAIAAWGEFAENRLLLLVRSVIGGFWTDDEVTYALTIIPSWWAQTEQGAQPGTSGSY